MAAGWIHASMDLMAFGRSYFDLHKYKEKKSRFIKTAMIKIYCDTGGYQKLLKPLIDQNKIKVFGWPYENKNEKIKNKGTPSKATWEDMKHVTWEDADIRWSDTDESGKFQQIADIIGQDNVEDVKHLDSAYKSGCDYFLTSDRRHIIKHRKALRRLLGLKAIDHKDRDEILRAIKTGTKDKIERIIRQHIAQINEK